MTPSTELPTRDQVETAIQSMIEAAASGRMPEPLPPGFKAAAVDLISRLLIHRGWIKVKEPPRTPGWYVVSKNGRAEILRFDGEVWRRANILEGGGGGGEPGVAVISYSVAEIAEPYIAAPLRIGE